MISFDNSNVGSCHTPKEIAFGDGSSKTIEQYLSKWQIEVGNVLFVSDKQVSTIGLCDDVMKPLEKKGFVINLFEDIDKEPSLRTAQELVSFVRKKYFVAVIGIGGGSAMDMAKIAAIMATNDGEIEDYIGIANFKKPALPLIQIPTTAGTGAEATSVSMLSIDGKKAVVASPYLVPFLAVLDPLLTVSLPPNITAATGLDALSHAVEAYMSTNANPFTESHALSTISVISKWLSEAYFNGKNIKARRAMLFGAFSGGYCLNSGVVLGHSAAYTIANRTQLSHGVTCAMALPYAVSYNLSAISDRISIAAQKIFNGNEATAENFIIWLNNFNAKFGIPKSLKEIGLDEKEKEEMVEECMNKYPRPNNPVPFTKERISLFYDFLFEGDITSSIKVFAQD